MRPSGNNRWIQAAAVFGALLLTGLARADVCTEVNFGDTSSYEVSEKSNYFVKSWENEATFDFRESPSCVVMGRKVKECGHFVPTITTPIGPIMPAIVTVTRNPKSIMPRYDNIFVWLFSYCFDENTSFRNQTSQKSSAILDSSP